MEFERKRYHSHLDMAPLIDVVFNLLLFFMLTSQLIQQPVIKIKLPLSKTAQPVSERVNTITITKEGFVYLLDKRIDLENLSKLVGELVKDKEKDFLRIQADKDASVDILIKVIDEVKTAGVKNFSIVTERR
jgi:biopolymer transport protein ExbD